MLFEHGKVKESLPYYQKATELLPDATLIRLELAMAQLATEDKAYLKSATGELQQAVTEDPRNAMAWRQLAIAYGRNNDLGKSYLALAEEAALLGKKDDVDLFAAKAEKSLPKGSPEALRLKDLQSSMAEKKKSKK
jgi:predicted Zn-dependent protease